MTEAALLSPSSLDSKRFGVRVLRGLASTVPDATRMGREAVASGADLVIARCPTTPPPVAQALEAWGCFLCDTLVYFAGAVSPAAAPPDALASGRVRRLVEADVAPLSLVAEQAFSGFAGHYHADARLDGARATAGYVEWFQNQCRQADGVVLVSTTGGEPTGFLTLKLGASADDAEIVLNAVSPKAQGQGSYDALVKAAKHVAAQQGKTRLKVSTQLHNLAPQKVWARNGLEPSDSFYTFHWWADGARDRSAKP